MTPAPLQTPGRREGPLAHRLHPIHLSPPGKAPAVAMTGLCAAGCRQARCWWPGQGGSAPRLGQGHMPRPAARGCLSQQLPIETPPAHCGSSWGARGVSGFVERSAFFISAPGPPAPDKGPPMPSPSAPHGEEPGLRESNVDGLESRSCISCSHDASHLPSPQPPLSPCKNPESRPHQQHSNLTNSHNTSYPAHPNSTPPCNLSTLPFCV